jgi:hypothetical protein
MSPRERRPFWHPRKGYSRRHGASQKKATNVFFFGGARRLGFFMLSWERIAEIAKDPGRALDAEIRCALDVDVTEEWLFVRSAYTNETEPGVAHYVLFRRRDLPMVSPRAFLRGVLGRAVDDGNVAWFETPHGSGAGRYYDVFVRAPTGCTQLSDDLDRVVDVHAQVADAYSSWLLHVESIERDSQSSRTGV